MRGFKFDESLKRSINRRWYVSSETQKNGEDTEPQGPGQFIGMTMMGL